MKFFGIYYMKTVFVKAFSLLFVSCESFLTQKCTYKQTFCFSWEANSSSECVIRISQSSVVHKRFKSSCSWKYWAYQVEGVTIYTFFEFLQQMCIQYINLEFNRIWKSQITLLLNVILRYCYTKIPTYERLCLPSNVTFEKYLSVLIQQPLFVFLIKKHITTLTRIIMYMSNIRLNAWTFFMRYGDRQIFLRKLLKQISCNNIL